MATFLKYLIYIFILAALYIVGKGIYDGSITSDTTVGEVVSQVDKGTGTMAKNAAGTIGRAVEQLEEKGRK